jgi:CubicO group peptidase (beta-lactamase class C family)
MTPTPDPCDDHAPLEPPLASAGPSDRTDRTRQKGRRRLLCAGAALGLGSGAPAGLAAVLGAGLLGAAEAGAQPGVPAGAARPPDTAAATDDPALQALLATRAQAEGMGLAAAVVTTDGVRTGYGGRRSAGDARAPDGLSAFEYGSITKTVIGLLLAEMSLRRELALDEPVSAALGRPLRDSAGADITWEDLATHRSGLPRLPADFAPRNPADPYADADAAALDRFLDSWRPPTRRQTAWAYSNLGFGLLGHALARRAGQPLPVLLRERVLRPLGLDGMGLAMVGTPAPGLLPGHDERGRAVPRWTFDTLAGAGALWGTAPQLARYAQAALGLVETPLAPALALALQPRAAAAGSARIGLGWLLAPLNGRTVATHDGGTYGFSSSLVLDVERRRAALVLANAQVVVNDLAVHLADPSVPARDVAAERQQRERTPVTLPPGQLAPLAGTYALNPQFRLTVRVREGRLFAQATGQGEFELFALEPLRFFARVAAIDVQFDAPAGPGGAPALTLLQGGQRLRFTRQDD